MRKRGFFATPLPLHTRELTPPALAAKRREQRGYVRELDPPVPVRVLDRELQHADHALERRAHLVRHVGHELALGRTRLLGVHILGENAAELLHTGMMVMQFGGTLNAFIDSVFNFPTLSEAYKYAAYDAMGRVTAANKTKSDLDTAATQADTIAKQADQAIESADSMNLPTLTTPSFLNPNP